MLWCILLPQHEHLFTSAIFMVFLFLLLSNFMHLRNKVIYTLFKSNLYMNANVVHISQTYFWDICDFGIFMRSNQSLNIISSCQQVPLQNLISFFHFLYKSLYSSVSIFLVFYYRKSVVECPKHFLQKYRVQTRNSMNFNLTLKKNSLRHY